MINYDSPYRNCTREEVIDKALREEIEQRRGRDSSATHCRKCRHCGGIRHIKIRLSDPLWCYGPRRAPHPPERTEIHGAGDFWPDTPDLGVEE